eukprot:403354177
MEYKRGGCLKSSLKAKGVLTEGDAKLVIYQILQALSNIHKKQIIHRDLTPANILFDNKIYPSQKLNTKISIADFGLSIHKQELEYSKIKCGTPGYMAPESIRLGIYSEKSDIFGVGCLIYRMITGQNLFSGINSMEILKKNMYCLDVPKIIQLKLSKFSEDFKDLVNRCLNLNINLRPSAEEALQHSWFTYSKQLLLSNLNKNGSFKVSKNQNNNLLMKKEGLYTYQNQKVLGLSEKFELRKGNQGYSQNMEQLSNQ